MGICNDCSAHWLLDVLVLQATDLSIEFCNKFRFPQPYQESQSSTLGLSLLAAAALRLSRWYRPREGFAELHRRSMMSATMMQMSPVCSKQSSSVPRYYSLPGYGQISCMHLWHCALTGTGAHKCGCLYCCFPCVAPASKPNLSAVPLDLSSSTDVNVKRQPHSPLHFLQPASTCGISPAVKVQHQLLPGTSIVPWHCRDCSCKKGCF